MPATAKRVLPTSEAAIFARLWDGGASLTPELARHVLGLKFIPADEARVRELIDRNREGKISATELDELDNYVRVGDLLALLQSKARQRLKQTPTTQIGHN
jgi:hypothetical protein